jgi:hypothetical protein
MKTKKEICTRQFQRSIPILIKEELDKIDYQRKDNLYVILDLIYSKTFYFKTKAQKEYSFTEIPLASFKEYLLDNTKIQEDINFLVDAGYVIRNNYYNYNEGRCKGYKIAEEYVSKKVTVTITNPKINAKIKAKFKEMRKRKEKNLELQQQQFYKTFKINHNDALAYVENLAKQEIKSLCFQIGIRLSSKEVDDLINCVNNFRNIKKLILGKEGGNELLNIMHRYCIYTSQINKIHEGYLYFKRNQTNGRLDTNLTSLPSFLRPFIECEQDLYSIDLKSSQPFFLYTAIKDDESIPQEEKDLYKQLVVSGETNNGIGLYEFLESEYEKTFKKPTNRKKMKELVFKIFYSKPKSYSGFKEFFSKYFPHINEWINQKKQKDYKSFAIMLQKIESSIILDVILPMLAEKGITPYTIHDSFVTTESDVNHVVDMIVDVCTVEFGFVPNLHIDCITKLDIEDIEVEDDFIDYTIEDELSNEPLPEPQIVMQFEKLTPEKIKELIQQKI